MDLEGRGYKILAKQEAEICTFVFIYPEYSLDEVFAVALAPEMEENQGIHFPVSSSVESKMVYQESKEECAYCSSHTNDKLTGLCPVPVEKGHTVPYNESSEPWFRVCAICREMIQDQVDVEECDDMETVMAHTM